MALVYKLTDLPPVWPGKRTTYHKKAPFKSQWSRTLHNLEREIRHLGGRNVEIALELPRGAFDLRQDGMLRSDARPKPAVILSFLDRDGQRQAYPCDTYGWYQDNLHAIAVVLEDLRRAERYGVQSALLRAGFKALPATTTTTTLSTEEAARTLVQRTMLNVASADVLRDLEVARRVYREVRQRAHPDRGGSAAEFTLVQEAARILGAHFGGTL